LLRRSQWFFHAEINTAQMCGDTSRKEFFG
jgi:hypothetical protein